MGDDGRRLSANSWICIIAMIVCVAGVIYIEFWG